MKGIIYSRDWRSCCLERLQWLLESERMPDAINDVADDTCRFPVVHSIAIHRWRFDEKTATTRPYMASLSEQNFFWINECCVSLWKIFTRNSLNSLKRCVRDSSRCCYKSFDFQFFFYLKRYSALVLSEKQSPTGPLLTPKQKFLQIKMRQSAISIGREFCCVVYDDKRAKRVNGWSWITTVGHIYSRPSFYYSLPLACALKTFSLHSSAWVYTGKERKPPK